MNGDGTLKLNHFRRK